MELKYCITSFVLQVLIGICLPSAGGTNGEKSSVMVISLGSIRWSSLPQLPHLKQFFSGDASVVRLKSVFPTEQLPSAVSLTTGLHPESHGLVANRMVDHGKVFEAFADGENDPMWWYRVVPVWATARKQGIESAVVGFPGANVLGLEPSFVNQSSSLDQRVEIAAKWLVESSAYQRRLLFLDLAAHNVVEESISLASTDRYLNVLFERLKKSNTDRMVDIIITGTHGRMESKKQRRMCLDKYASPPDVEVIDQSAGMISLTPAEGKEGAVLSKLSSPELPARTYLRLDVPTRLHYTHSRRIPDLVVLAKPGFRLSASCTEGKANRRPSGQAGYDNDFDDMHTFFVAKGPSFQEHASVKKASLLDVYPLVCHLLGIKPQPNNGSLAVLKPLLSESQSQQPLSINKASDETKLQENLKTFSPEVVRKGPNLSAGGVILILIGAVVFSLGLFALREYFKRQRQTKGGYRLMERSFEPDLSLRSEPLLLDDSLSYRSSDSIQLSIMSESGGGMSMRDNEEDDDSPPSTFRI